MAGDENDKMVAPAAEIEVTPEMIEVGVKTLYGFDITEWMEAELRQAVRSVFIAMREQQMAQAKQG